MANRPILFSGAMVRALLAGTKTQTRRTLKFQPASGISIIRQTIRPLDAAPYHAFQRRSVYGNYAGDLDIRIKRSDRLWVRETLKADSNDQGHRWVTYGADGAVTPHGLVRWDWKRDSIPSIHMPRWASRLTLTVTDVRVERLQDISEQDAIAEGADISEHHRSQITGGPMVKVGPGTYMSPIAWYHRLWDEINGAGSWDANPWVVAYTFTVERGNIDQIGRAAA